MPPLLKGNYYLSSFGRIVDRYEEYRNIGRKVIDLKEDPREKSFIWN